MKKVRFVGDWLGGSIFSFFVNSFKYGMFFILDDLSDDERLNKMDFRIFFI